VKASRQSKGSGYLKKVPVRRLVFVSGTKNLGEYLGRNGAQRRRGRNFTKSRDPKDEKRSEGQEGCSRSKERLGVSSDERPRGAGKEGPNLDGSRGSVVTVSGVSQGIGGRIIGVKKQVVNEGKGGPHMCEKLL